MKRLIVVGTVVMALLASMAVGVAVADDGRDFNALADYYAGLIDKDELEAILGGPSLPPVSPQGPTIQGGGGGAVGVNNGGGGGGGTPVTVVGNNGNGGNGGTPVNAVNNGNGGGQAVSVANGNGVPPSTNPPVPPSDLPHDRFWQAGRNGTCGGTAWPGDDGEAARGIGWLCNLDTGEWTQVQYRIDPPPAEIIWDSPGPCQTALKGTHPNHPGRVFLRPNPEWSVEACTALHRNTEAKLAAQKAANIAAWAITLPAGSCTMTVDVREDGTRRYRAYHHHPDPTTGEWAQHYLGNWSTYEAYAAFLDTYDCNSGTPQTSNP